MEALLIDRGRQHGQIRVVDQARVDPIKKGLRESVDATEVKTALVWKADTTGVPLPPAERAPARLSQPVQVAVRVIACSALFHGSGFVRVLCPNGVSRLFPSPLSTASAPQPGSTTCRADNTWFQLCRS